MAHILLGNVRAGQLLAGEWQPLPGDRITSVDMPDHLSHADAIRTIMHPDGLWRSHSLAPAPAWVESDDAALAAAISNAVGCPIGRPDTWEG